MSSGSGCIMRAVEARLTDQPQRVIDLAGEVFAVQAGALTRGQIEAVRRACKRLAELDRASLTRVRGAARASSGRGSTQRFLAARAPLTAADREHAERRAAEAHRALVAALEGRRRR